MYRVGFYRRYQLYQLDGDELLLLNTTGSHYERNCLVVYRPDVSQLTIDSALGIYADMDKAAQAVNDDLEQQAQRAREQLLRVAAISDQRNMERLTQRQADEKKQQRDGCCR